MTTDRQAISTHGVELSASAQMYGYVFLREAKEGEEPTAIHSLTCVHARWLGLALIAAANEAEQKDAERRGVL